MDNDLLDLTKRIIVLRGGPGSGNWGHTGRPTKRGGSGKGGGLARIGAKPGSSHRERRKASETHRKNREQDKQGEKLFNKIKHGGQLKLTDGDLEVDVSIKTFGGAYGMAVKRPSDKSFGKHYIRPTHYIKNYLGQFRERSQKAQTKADLTYKSGSHTGAMIALFLPREYAEVYALRQYENALPPDELHITLAYLGDADDLTNVQKDVLHEMMEFVSENHPILKGAINGVGRFCNGDEEGDPFIIIPDLPQLPNLRQIFVDWLNGNDIEHSKDHGFVPHITLGYFSHNEPNPFETVERQEIVFPTISLVLGDSRYDYPLGGNMETKADLITKIGARHTGKEYDLIQRMHNLACDLGAACQRQTEKAGAKHSMVDTQMIQRIHDDCVKLGAACKIDKSKPPIPMPEMYDLMHKGQLDAPNYLPASRSNRCENCIFFVGDPGRDYCELYEFTADKDYVCDAWEPQKPDEIPGYQVGRSLAKVMGGVLTIRER